MNCPTCDQMLEIDILGTRDDWLCPVHGPIRVKQEVSAYRQLTRKDLAAGLASVAVEAD